MRLVKQGVQINKIQQFLNSLNLTLPKDIFVYNPKTPSSFSVQGERMVEELLGITPIFAAQFNQVFETDYQESIAKSTFLRLSEEYKSDHKQPHLTGGKKYFETKRKFGLLVPTNYKRTVVPRISTTGSSFHGMNKKLLIAILKEMSLHKNAVFIDVDMSAAHSRIARFLLNDKESNLDKSLSDTEFWPKQVTLYQPYLSGLNLSDKTVKKILKVGLYTSLNGGNPSSNARLIDNISLNAKDYVESHNLNSIEEIMNDTLFHKTKQLLDDFELVKEVKDLSSNAFEMFYDKEEQKNVYFAYTVDRVKPYEFESGHKGISRVLQGFEVVLLSTLIHSVLSIGAKIVSLDHDGTLIMISQKQFESSFKSDPFELCQKLSKSTFSDFSEYLLSQSVSIEPKRLIIKGEATEY